MCGIVGYIGQQQAMLTLPLAFPGVVVGFMVIMLAGRQGLIGEISLWFSDSKLVFAYSMAGPGFQAMRLTLAGRPERRTRRAT